MDIQEQIQFNLQSLQKKTAKKKPYVKPQSVKDLESEYTAYYYQGRDIPFQTPFRFRDDTANGLTECICRYMKLRGYFAARVNTTGTFNKRLGRFIKTGARKGMADITAVVDGRHLSIEVKAGKDRPREEQLKVQQEIENAGGRYIFVRSFDDFLSKMEDL